MGGELPVVIEVWARLVERCAHQRVHGMDAREVSASWEGAGAAAQHLRASEAGQDGLLSLILRRRIGPETTLGAELGRVITSLKTLLLLSHERSDFFLTYHPRHVVLPSGAAEVLRDAALLLLLWTIDDGAIDIVVVLERGEDGQVIARLESNHAGLVPLPEQDQRIQTLRSMLGSLGGTVVRRQTPHKSYEVLLIVPTGQEPQ
jgi:hypothetical protein